ncbi:MlaA family lipoprotein [Azospirillum agricola]|uniref:MlaA family lipoprotein n=1 Tax=Azospirillum agricola TaxID=1720247 RepID=UPI000A0F3C37|nr:MlaA family lipoprotein [Azospirillum agricola]SMH35484.1 phospholipid-binding lipoprotein MlaA [Azospirillum lipoferum]
MRLRPLLATGLLALTGFAVPAAAEGVSVPAEAPPHSAAPVPAGGILDGYSRFMFDANRALYARLDQASAWWSGTPAGAAAVPPAGSGSLGNVVANLVNEPVTAVTALAVGEFAGSWRSVERFAINSTAGALGYYDTATAWGYESTHTDPGLSLCKAGVGEGPYVVLPFIGPRTVRDAVSDVVLTNAVLWIAAGSLFGTGASVQTIVIAESVEVVADIVATRQIDPQAKAIGFTDYDTTRDRYLAQRRARCAALRGEAAGQS